MDVIVSNPPYIPYFEKQTMHDNVLLWEPESALFVPDEQPLLFYTSIVEMAELQLNTGGALYFETHEEHHRDVAEFAESRGWSKVESRHDMQGKHRMLKLSW
jgi:release factor glutamine methyltransferase